jgi:hypothetical protein
LDIYFPRGWYYRNSAVLIRTWSTQIRKNNLRVKHDGLWITVFLSRTGLFLRFQNLFNQNSYQKRRKIPLWYRSWSIAWKCMLCSRSRIKGVSLTTFKEARGYRKNNNQASCKVSCRENAVVRREQYRWK